MVYELFVEGRKCHYGVGGNIISCNDISDYLNNREELVRSFYEESKNAGLFNRIFNGLFGNTRDSTLFFLKNVEVSNVELLKNYETSKLSMGGFVNVYSKISYDRKKIELKDDFSSMDAFMDVPVNFPESLKCASRCKNSDLVNLFIGMSSNSEIPEISSMCYN